MCSGLGLFLPVAENACLALTFSCGEMAEQCYLATQLCVLNKIRTLLMNRLHQEGKINSQLMSYFRQLKQKQREVQVSVPLIYRFKFFIEW